MKASQKIALAAAVGGIAAGFALAWYLPGLHWGWYVGAGVAVTAIGDWVLMRDAADRKIVDSD